MRKGSDKVLAMLKNLVFISKNNELLTLVEGYFISVYTIHTVEERKKKNTGISVSNFPLEFRPRPFFFPPEDLKQESVSFQSKV